MQQLDTVSATQRSPVAADDCKAPALAQHLVCVDTYVYFGQHAMCLQLLLVKQCHPLLMCSRVIRAEHAYPVFEKAVQPCLSLLLHAATAWC